MYNYEYIGGRRGRVSCLPETIRAAADPALLDAAFRALPRREQVQLLRTALTFLPGRPAVDLKGLSRAERRALMATILEPLPVPDWCFIAELVFMAVRQQAPKEGRRTS
jgi:hypothetical protein